MKLNKVTSKLGTSEGIKSLINELVDFDWQHDDEQEKLAFLLDMLQKVAVEEVLKSLNTQIAHKQSTNNLQNFASSAEYLFD